MAIRLSLALIGLFCLLNNFSHAQVIVFNPYETNYKDPRLAYLHGLADLGRKTAVNSKIYAEAQVVWEKAKQANLETRRKEIEYVAYEMEKLAEIKVRKEELKNEVAGGKAAMQNDPNFLTDKRLLHELLKYLKDNKHLIDPENSEPIQPDCLRYIALNTGKSDIGGSLALLKEQTIPWPMLFQDRIFEKEKKVVDDSMMQLKHQAISPNGPDLILFRTINAALRVMVQKRRDLIDGPGYEPIASSNAGKFLEGLLLCMRDLQMHPESLKILFKQAQGKNVLEFVNFMEENGLSIAEASEQLLLSYHQLWEPLRKEARKIVGIKRQQSGTR